MNRKGFTLIELLGVILIISLLVIIVLPKITNSVNNFSAKTDKLMLQMIKDAAKLYVDDNSNEFEENEYGYYCVSLTELVNKNYLKKGIEISGKDITNSKSLKINYNEDNKIELVDSDKCVITELPGNGDSESTVIVAGLYDKNDVLLASWDELVEAGLDVETDLSYSERTTNTDILDNYGDSYKLVIDTSVTSIGSYAFSGCTGLTSITIPESVTSIGDYAFERCTSLTSITIPESVTSIGISVFVNCTNLTSIKVDENNSVYDSRDNSNAIIETATNTLIAGCKNTVIPNSATSIGIYAFSGCTGLTSIAIPDSVTSIGERAFSGCTSLTSITIPDSVTSIGKMAFYCCYRLTSITIPESVTSIGDYAFERCTSLTSITIPESVTSIGISVFVNCTNLTSIKVDENNSVYDSRDNSNAIIETATNTLIAGCKNTVIPNSATSIGIYAFSGCTGLTSIAIPDSVTSIGTLAFADCTGLTSITIPSSVTSIGYMAFYSCKGLTSITIPDSVTSIGSEAFYGCTGLNSIYYSGTATGSPWGAHNATVISE